jgi:hypothetical protein
MIGIYKDNPTIEFENMTLDVDTDDLKNKYFCYKYKKFVNDIIAEDRNWFMDIVKDKDLIKDINHNRVILKYNEHMIIKLDCINAILIDSGHKFHKDDIDLDLVKENSKNIKVLIPLIENIYGEVKLDDYNMYYYNRSKELSSMYNYLNELCFKTFGYYININNTILY